MILIDFNMEHFFLDTDVSLHKIFMFEKSFSCLVYFTFFKIEITTNTSTYLFTSTLVFVIFSYSFACFTKKKGVGDRNRVKVRHFKS